MMESQEITSPGLGEQNASFAPACGGILLKYSVGGRQILHCPDNWREMFPKKVSFGNPILFPIASFLDLDGELDLYKSKGREYRLPQHGFARQLPWKVVLEEPHLMRCEIVATTVTQALFPWDFHAQVSYSLGDRGMVISAEVTNRSDDPMPLQWGFHPYFKLDAPQSEYRIETPACKKAYIFRDPEIKLEDPLLIPLDDKLAGTRLQEGTGTGYFRLIHTPTGREIRVGSDTCAWDTWAIWSPNVETAYVCIEPWTAPPNALNSGDRLIRLAKGETWKGHFEIQVV